MAAYGVRLAYERHWDQTNVRFPPIADIRPRGHAALPMYLPLRLAVGLPIAIVTVLAFGFALATVAPTRLPMWIKFHQVGGLVLMAGAASLLLVVPNLFAAVIANRMGSGHWASFAGAFAATFLIAWFAQARLLDRGMRVMGGFPATFDMKFIMLLATNCAACAIAASWHGKFPGGS